MTVEGQTETLTVHSSGTQHLLQLLWVWGDLPQGDLHRGQVRTKIIRSVCVLCNKKALETSSLCWQPAERDWEKVINNNNGDTFAFHLPFPSQDLKDCSHNNAMKLPPPQAGWDVEAKKD